MGKLPDEVKKKLDEQEKEKDEQANKEAQERIEDEVVELNKSVIAWKPTMQYREACAYKYIDAFLNFKETKKLVDLLRDELEAIDDGVQMGVKRYLESGKKRNMLPGGVEAQRALTLMDRIPLQAQEIERYKRLCKFYAGQVEELDKLLAEIPKEEGDNDTGDVAAMPTIGKSFETPA